MIYCYFLRYNLITLEIVVLSKYPILAIGFYLGIDFTFLAYLIYFKPYKFKR